MTSAMRPMNLGGILDRAIQILRARFSLFAGIAVLPGLAQLGVQLASVHPQTTTDPTPAHSALVVASYGATFAFQVADLILYGVATAAMCFAASRVHFDETITIRAALGPFVSQRGRLVWLAIIQGFYAGWPLFIFGFVAIAVGASGSHGYLGTAILVVGSIPCIALYARYALAFPACAIENLTAQDAIDRSVALGEGSRWRICGGFLLPAAAAMTFILGSEGLITRLKMTSPLLAGSPIVVAGLNGIVELISALVFTPLSAIVITLLYYDQRIRREGYDIERMMQQAGMVAGSPKPETVRWVSPVPQQAETEDMETPPQPGEPA